MKYDEVRSIPLSMPNIGDKEREYVLRVLNSPQLALGPMLSRFEEQMAAQCGAKHAVAVSSGTAALHLIVRGLGIGRGDEVITTPFSFVASSNCLLYEGAVPRFVDIDASTLSFDLDRLQDAISPSTKAILGVDVFGSPAPWPELQNLARRHDLHLIDDACEAPGAAVGGRPIGSWGNAAAFGFYPNKQITTGEGGCITTSDDELAANCRSMRNQGRSDPAKMEHVMLGFNYRLDEMSAALGCAQLERLPGLLAQRTRVADLYREALEPFEEDLVLPTERAGATRSWFVYVVRLHERFAEDARDRLMDMLKAHKIGCAAYFPSIHLQPYYRERFDYKPGDFPVCEAISNQCLALPFYPALLPDDVFRIARVLGTLLPQLPKRVKTFQL